MAPLAPVVLFLASCAFPSSAMDVEEPHPDETNETSKILQGEQHLPSLNECGFQALTDNRFVGGKLQIIREEPWTAALQVINRRRGRRPRQVRGLRVHCLGALITHKHVLTAAHCLYRDNSLLDPSNLKVWLGKWELRKYSKEDVAYIKKYGVRSINPYSSFDPRDEIHKDDIGLVELSITVRYNDYIRPACLPREKLRFEFIGTMLRLNVWRDQQNTQGKGLRWKISVPIMDNLDCEKKYKLKAKTLPRNNQFCVGGEDEEDSCQGNFGGPLMDSARLSEEKQLWYVFGVASYGVPRCAYGGRPAVYIHVSIYIPWILEEVLKTFAGSGGGEGGNDRHSIKGYLHRR